MAENPNNPTSLLQERAIALREKMKQQHPLHEYFALTFEAVGGLAYLQEFAEDNPKEFLTMFAKMAPPPQPQQGKGGGLSLTLALHPALAPGPLDITPENTLTIDHEPDAD
jgi:hypothetical protein